MTTIAIVPDSQDRFRAVANGRQATGKTPGEALDSMTAQLTDADSGTIVVVQHRRPDRFFTAAQVDRLADLMDRWRLARDGGPPLSIAEREELEASVEEETAASGERAKALLAETRP